MLTNMVYIITNQRVESAGLEFVNGAYARNYYMSFEKINKQ